MKFKIQWRIRAVKQIKKIPASDSKRIRQAIDKLENSETWGDVRKLTDHEYDYRLRVGNYRILFNTENAIQIVTVEEVKKRDEGTY